MAETPTVYVICDQNCKFEGMTKEQIYAAIIQAVNEGTIGDIDTGFIQTIKTINGTPLKFFVGEQHEYEALTDEQKENLFAIITNDTTKSGIEAAISALQEETESIRNALQTLNTEKVTAEDVAEQIGEFKEKIESGKVVAENANFAAMANSLGAGDNVAFKRTKLWSGTHELPAGGTHTENYISISNSTKSLLVVELDLFAGSEYDNQFYGRFRTPPFYVKHKTGTNYDIGSVFKFDACGEEILFYMKDNSKLCCAHKNKSTSNTGSTVYIKAIYKEE